MKLLYYCDKFNIISTYVDKLYFLSLIFLK
nr:MAG TPA: hypothetical protein [Caudoviricetes sp.]